MSARAVIVKRRLRFAKRGGKDSGMSEDQHPSGGQPPKLSREERLAAKLRENLRRRKAQARAVANRDGDRTRESHGLSKAPPES